MPRPPIWRREGFSSRRQYENSRARAAGFENYSQWQKLRSDPAYKKLISFTADLTGKTEHSLRRLDSAMSKRVAEESPRAIVNEIGDAFGEEIDDFDFDEYDWVDVDDDAVSNAVGGE